MWHIELFNARTGPQAMVSLFRDRALPYWRQCGFDLYLFATQHELGPRDFWFLTWAPSFSDLDLWAARATGEPEGAALMRELMEGQAGSPRASLAAELPVPGSAPLRWDACPMWHVELFNSAGQLGEMEGLLQDEVLPYWRSRGFTAHALSTQYGLGPRAYWLLTGLDRFGSFDEWGEMALGEERGRRLMARLDALIVDKRAHVIQNAEVQ